MSKKPRALDLFCGAGGAAMGLHQAGFDVLGIDIKPQKNYPFAFIQADALDPPVNLADFDFIWASPPCQLYCSLNSINKREYPDHIPDVRKMVQDSGKHYCIENVPNAPLINPIRLCGTSFGLSITAHGQEYELRRHRHFECSFFMLQPPCCHRHKTIGVFGGGSDKRGFRGTADLRREVMEMPWANRNEIAEAIPPAYGEFIGRAAIQAIKQQKESLNE